MSDQAKPTADLRSRTRRAVQNEIGALALDLFLERGFADVTVDEICARAGISSRSFFRYFATKEDTVLGRLAQAGTRLQAALEARPAAEAPWDALRAAFRVLIAEFAESGVALRATTRLLLETPGLRARQLERQLYWQDLLIPDIARRIGSGPSGTRELRARALVASALACLDAAGVAWATAEDGSRIETFLDAAFDAVRG